MNNTAALKANQAIDVDAAPFQFGDVPAEQTLQGVGHVGLAELGRLGECNIGVWQISESVTKGVEEDEFFIVLAGRATVSFDDGTAPMQLKPGSIGRVAAGTTATWTVTEALRKVYLVHVPG